MPSIYTGKKFEAKKLHPERHAATVAAHALALAAGLALHDGWHDDAWLLSALALLPALLGMWLGQRIRSRLSPQRFRQGFLLFLLALGIELIARGWLV